MVELVIKVPREAPPTAAHTDAAPPTAVPPSEEEHVVGTRPPVHLRLAARPTAIAPPTPKAEHKGLPGASEFPAVSARRLGEKAAKPRPRRVLDYNKHRSPHAGRVGEENLEARAIAPQVVDGNHGTAAVRCREVPSERGELARGENGGDPEKGLSIGILTLAPRLCRRHDGVLPRERPRDDLP